jgi:hypothetical protein
VLLAVDVLWALQCCRLGHALERKRAAAGLYCDLADAAEGTLTKQLTLLEHQLAWQGNNNIDNNSPYSVSSLWSSQ